MGNRFRVRAKAAPHGRFLLIGIVGLLSLTCFEVYRMIVPFVSANPLWSQVTIGEPVIHDWRYGGVDEEGYLKFYNPAHASVPVLIPPNARMFDADGQFVILEGHTPSSLTFAQPYDAIPAKWAVLVVAVAAVPIVIFSLRFRQKRRRIKMRTKISRKSIGRHRLVLRMPVRQKSFRPKRRPWS